MHSPTCEPEKGPTFVKVDPHGQVSLRLKRLRYDWPGPLNPQLEYVNRMSYVLRSVAKFVAHRGWAPTLAQLVKRNDWNERAARWYLNDAVANGWLERNRHHGFMLTAVGFGAINIEPIEPILPTDERLRERHRRQAREFLRLEQDAERLREVARLERQ